MKFLSITLIDVEDDCNTDEIEESVQDIVMECSGVDDASTVVVSIPDDMTLARAQQLVTGSSS